VHIHLDAIGGIAGDMFLASVIDARPDLVDQIEAAMRLAGLPVAWQVVPSRQKRAGIEGVHVAIEPPEGGETRPSGTWRAIRERLGDSSLDGPVKARAIDIFQHLALAEATVHGVAIDDVHFHELADWDSLADIVGAAAAIEALGVTGCTVSDIPFGKGRVMTEHGAMPVPAPATAKLLEGFRGVDDGIAGERVTPTGAAILAHLEASQETSGSGRLLATGIGLGTKDMPGIANILRLLCYENDGSRASDTVAVIEFEIDDQSGEDLAVGLDRIRALDGVLDLIQGSVLAKKGRMAGAIRILCLPAQMTPVIEACFVETTTIGLRHRLERRVVLTRSAAMAEGVRTKRVERPAGATVKAEMDDLASAGNAAERARLRRSVEGTNDE
jgi:pyridinium-3,5-bisthiocarboxylic acid mononucleotide nickel chelatase